MREQDKMYQMEDSLSKKYIATFKGANSYTTCGLNKVKASVI